METNIFSHNCGKLHLFACFVLIFFQVPVYLSMLSVSASYLFFGGWRSLYIFCVTFPRNAKGALLLIKARLSLYRVLKSGDLIPDIVVQNANKHPNSTAFLYEDEVWTFRDLESYMNRVANTMVESGIAPGSVVAIFAHSRPQFVALWLGVVRAGFLPALVNFNLRSDSLAHCLDTAKAAAFIFDSELASAVLEIEDSRCRCQRLYFVGGPDGGLVPRAEDLESLVDTQSSEWRGGRGSAKFNDPMMYIYTSGTTGLPKPAVVTHSKVYIAAFVPHNVLGLTRRDVLYVPLPLYHSGGGLMGVGQALVYGTCVVVKKKFSASQFWSDCVKYKATTIQYIGEICRYLLAKPPGEFDRQHGVVKAFGNGLRPSYWTNFQQRFGIKQIGEFYGATESNANLINVDNTTGSVGFLLPSVAPTRLVRVDVETGKLVRDPKTGLCISCGPDEPGQLVGKIVRDSIIGDFHGYLDKRDNEKKIARDVFKRGDSYFMTGDILIMDEFGYVFFMDRTGDTFRWRGENVATAEVEATLTKILDLASCAVYGVEVPGTEGRAGMAAIEENGVPLNLPRLQEMMEKRLPSYARPMFVRIVKRLEMTGTFKMKKTKLMQEAFDPTATKDRLFYFDKSRNTYLPLNQTVYDDIVNGNIVF